MEPTLTKQMIIETIEELLNENDKKQFDCFNDLLYHLRDGKDLYEVMGKKYNLHHNYITKERNYTLVFDVIKDYYDKLSNRNKDYYTPYDYFERVAQKTFNDLVANHHKFNSLKECYDYYTKLEHLNDKINDKYLHRPLNFAFEPDFDRVELLIIRDIIIQWYNNNNNNNKICKGSK
jgi:hypothetical protein